MTLRRRLGANTVTALQRQKNSRLRALTLDAVVLVLALVFMARNLADLPYLLLALPFALFAIAAGSVDLREWQTLGRVDFAQPLAALRAHYDVLRQRRLQLALAIAQVSTLLWLPMLMVLVQGLAGIDLLGRGGERHRRDVGRDGPAKPFKFEIGLAVGSGPLEPGFEFVGLVTHRP